MKRRSFLATGAAMAAAPAAMGGRRGQPEGQPEQGAQQQAAKEEGKKFSLAYAPHFGMFQHSAGNDPIAQLEFAADAGFTAWEDNQMTSRSEEEQMRIAEAMERLGMRMGIFVANFGTAFGKKSFVRNDPAMIDSFMTDLQKAVDVAKRVNATWMTVVPGELDPRIEMGYQTANAIEMLRRGADLCAPEGLVMVLEPLNPWRDHPGMFLSKCSQAYEICRAVQSPACKILFDIYHAQISEGNLIPNIELAWEEIAYFQIGDNPGRMEPTTGEINYRNIFRYLKQKDYQGILGMEHNNSKGGIEGEQAVITAYRWCDE